MSTQTSMTQASIQEFKQHYPSGKSAVYTEDSNGEIWHTVQFNQTIRMEKYGTMCSLFRRFEWRNMAQTDDSNA